MNILLSYFSHQSRPTEGALLRYKSDLQCLNEAQRVGFEEVNHLHKYETARAGDQSDVTLCQKV